MAKNKYRFQDKKPFEQIPTGDLNKKTLSNLQVLSNRLHIDFEPVALRWKVKQPNKTAFDTVIYGNIHGIPVEFWRHETPNPMGGQTLMYINNKKFNAVDLIANWENTQNAKNRKAKDIKSLQAVLPEDIVNDFLSDVSGTTVINVKAKLKIAEEDLPEGRSKLIIASTVLDEVFGFPGMTGIPTRPGTLSHVVDRRNVHSTRNTWPKAGGMVLNFKVSANSNAEAQRIAENLSNEGVEIINIA